MCEHGQRGVLSARPRSGRVKQLGVWWRCEPPWEGLEEQPLENLRILGLLDIFNTLRSREGKLNELGCKDGGNVIFWNYLEINVNAIKHFNDHSRIK